MAALSIVLSCHRVPVNVYAERYNLARSEMSLNVFSLCLDIQWWSGSREKKQRVRM